MCQAVQEMCDDARAEGHASGLSEGHAQGLQDHALLTAQRMLQDPGSHLRISAGFQGYHLRMF